MTDNDSPTSQICRIFSIFICTLLNITRGSKPFTLLLVFRSQILISPALIKQRNGLLANGQRKLAGSSGNLCDYEELAGLRPAVRRDAIVLWPEPAPFRTVSK